MKDKFAGIAIVVFCIYWLSKIGLNNPGILIFLGIVGCLLAVFSKPIAVHFESSGLKYRLASVGPVGVALMLIFLMIVGTGLAVFLVEFLK